MAQRKIIDYSNIDEKTIFDFCDDIRILRFITKKQNPNETEYRKETPKDSFLNDLYLLADLLEDDDLYLAVQEEDLMLIDWDTSVGDFKRQIREEKVTELMKECRYYKGEFNSPFDKKQEYEVYWFWQAEEKFVSGLGKLCCKHLAYEYYERIKNICPDVPMPLAMELYSVWFRYIHGSKQCKNSSFSESMERYLSSPKNGKMQ